MLQPYVNRFFNLPDFDFWLTNTLFSFVEINCIDVLVIFIYLCHAHVDVSVGKILENVTLEIDLNIENFQGIPFNISWIIIAEFSLNFLPLEPMLLGAGEAFFT